MLLFDWLGKTAERMSLAPSRVIYVRNVSESSKKPLLDFLSAFGKIVNSL